MSNITEIKEKCLKNLDMIINLAGEIKQGKEFAVGTVGTADYQVIDHNYIETMLDFWVAELKWDLEHLGSEHLGSEHLGSEHLGSEHLGSEEKGENEKLS